MTDSVTLTIESVGDASLTVVQSSQASVSVVTNISLSFSQETPSDTWLFNHFMNKEPVPSVIDSQGDVLFGDVSFPSMSQIQISFKHPHSGTLYLV